MLDAASSSQVRQAPPPPPPARDAVDTVHDKMESGFFNPITNGDVKDAVGALTALDPSNTRAAISELARDGVLVMVTSEINYV